MIKENTKANIKPGYKKTPVGIIPEDWEVKRINDFAEIKGRIGFRGYTKDDIVEKGEGAVSISPSNFKNGILDITDSTYISWFKYEESPEIKVQQGDVLLVKTGSTYGKTCFVQELPLKSTINPQIVIIKEVQINKRFLGFLVSTSLFNKEIERIVVGGAIPTISQKEISRIQLPIPPLPEQKAIADCLSTWDKAIEKLSALIAAKKEQKKGLMQGIFSGKLKVENGELVKVEDKENWLKGWKEVRLGDLGKTFNGLTGKTKDDFGVGLPFVSYLNVFRNNKIEENTSFDYVNIESSENQNTLNYGDLIFTTSSETPNEVGISSVVLFKPKEKLYLNSFCFGMRLNDFSILKPEYAVYLLRGQNFRREMYKLAQGSTRYNLSKASFVKIQITVPSLEEQTAIAEVLTAADKEIELLEQKLEAFKIQEKGLMQVLLTGQKRLV